MNSIIKGPQDFWAGVMYIAFGGAAMYLARDYGMGTAARMGPGYFPTVLGGLLMLFGVSALLRSFIRPGEAIGAIAWKPLLRVTAAILLFAVLVQTGGLILALLALILVSAAASIKFRFEVRATLAMIGLIAFCALVFVKGLGVPMPLLGSWFGA